MIAEDEQAAVLLEIDEEHATAEAASDAFLAQEGMHLVERGLGTVNDLSARYVVADVENSDGQTLRLRAHFIDFDGTVIQFLGLSSRESFGNYDSQFQRTMRGFKRLTDAQLLNRQPERLILSSTQSDSVSPRSSARVLTKIALARINAQTRYTQVRNSGTAAKVP